MQELSSTLTQLLKNKQHFKIKFNKYDGGIHTFYPNYKNCVPNVCMGDIVAWIWGDSLKFGLILKVMDLRLYVELIIRRDSNSQIKLSIDRRIISCIFQPI